MTAAIGLYCFFREGEHGARVVIAATAGSQTEHVFGTMRYMAQGEYLKSLGVQVFKRAIVHEASELARSRRSTAGRTVSTARIPTR